MTDEQAATPPIRVALFESDPLVRAGLEQILAKAPDMQVTSTTSSLRTAVSALSDHVADVALIDTDDGLDPAFKAAARLRAADARLQIIFLATQIDDEQLLEAARVGASAVLTRDEVLSNLPRRIREVALGANLLTRQIFSRPSAGRLVLSGFRRRLSEHQRRVEAQPHGPLTAREIEILRCAAKGQSTRVIATQLQIGEQAVKNHITRVMRKLGVANRTAAVTLAVARGWLEEAEAPARRSG